MAFSVARVSASIGMMIAPSCALTPFATAVAIVSSVPDAVAAAAADSAAVGFSASTAAAARYPAVTLAVIAPSACATVGIWLVKNVPGAAIACKTSVVASVVKA